MRSKRIAVLGSGILGSSVALYLARENVDVVLFEAKEQPFDGASRWNEGKVHLGYLYAGDPTMRTARKLLPGGLAFRPLLEDLLSTKLLGLTDESDVYLIHRDSVANVDAAREYFGKLDRLVESHREKANYLIPLGQCRSEELTSQQLGQITDSTNILGGFQVPERSISTRWVADRFVDAIRAESTIELRTGTRVARVVCANDNRERLLVQTEQNTEGPFDLVVNALWESRLGVDATMGLNARYEWSNRYRVSVFLRTVTPFGLRSAVIAVGPFGDIKNYNGRDFYLSWYPDGLLEEDHGLFPKGPKLSGSERQSIENRIFDQLALYFPVVTQLREKAEESVVEGGWVFAKGQGSLSDPRSTLHKRHEVGIERIGNYVSVDTGKFSIAPWLAKQIVRGIA